MNELTVKNDFFKILSAYLNHETVNAEGMDFSTIFKLAGEQNLTAAVYSVICGQLPEPDEQLWHRSAMEDIAFQTRATIKFLMLYRNLLNRGFSPIVVKGIVCRQTYPEPDTRISTDEDLYIKREDYPAFHKAMLELGFEAEEPNYDLVHELRYHSKYLMVEGHWDLFPQSNDYTKAMNQLNEGFWNRAQTAMIEQVPMRILDPTDHMTFLLLHAFKHFAFRGVGVRQMMDVAQWAKKYSCDWNRVREDMRMVHAEYFAGAIFDAGEKYFGMSYPDGWPRADCEPLIDDSLMGGVFGSSTASRKHSSTITMDAVEEAHLGKRRIPLVRTIFPKRAIMVVRFPWVEKSVLLLPVAWVIRLFEYFFRNKNEESAAESINIGKERVELLKKYKII